MKDTPVTIAGCGALGSLLAARLINAGVSVQAYQRPGPHHDALRSDGITIQGDATWPDGPAGRQRYVLSAVASDASRLNPSRLMIVLVKSYHTAALAPLRPLLVPEGVVLTLQNGLGNAEQLAAVFGSPRIAAGTATYGAFRIAPGVIGWGGDGKIVMGPWQPDRDISWVGELLRDAGLDAQAVADPRPALWTKLAINVMVNPVAALTRMTNGQALGDPHTSALMQQLGREAVAAAGRAGVPLDFPQIWKLHMENLRRTAANRNSMLQDVVSGRRTEVASILGSILRYATDAGDLPTTRALYQLLTAIDGLTTGAPADARSSP